MVTIEEIRDHDAFHALAPEWGRLWRNLPDGEGTPFDTPAWYACCLAAEPNRRPALLAARRDGALVGVAPWWTGERRLRGLALRTVEFIANRESPRSGFVARPDARDETIRAFFRHAREAWRGRWDLLALQPWPVDAGDYAAAERVLAEARIRRYRARASLVPAVTVGGTWDEFLAGKSYLFRKSRRGILNRMGREEGVEVTRHRASPGPSLLDDLAAVSRLGWKHADGLSLAGREDSMRFFGALNDAGTREGWLDVWVLRIGGVPVAFEYDLRHGGVVYALRAEFDANRDRLSPGAYLEYFILKAAFDEGQREYSCGPGLDAYKLRWTDRRREHVSLRIYGSTPRARWAEGLEEHALPLLRRIRDAVAPERRAAKDVSSGEGEP